MEPSNWATIIVAAIALISAILSGRAAAGAAKYSSKAQAETEAYIRAREMDVKTIERQDKEIEELRRDNDEMQKKIRELKFDNEKIHEDNDRLRRRVTALERQLGEPNGEESDRG